MRKSIQKNDRSERRHNFILSPLMSGLKQAFGSFTGQAKPLSASPTQKEEPNINSSIRFEALEPRVLLSGDLNPAQTVSGSIDVQGEVDQYGLLRHDRRTEVGSYQQAQSSLRSSGFDG